MPAGMLVQAAQSYASKITVSANGRSADAKKVFAILGLAIKSGANVIATVEGPDEEQAIAELKDFFKENL